MLRMLTLKPVLPTETKATEKAPTAKTAAPVVTAAPLVTAGALTWRDMLPKLELSGMAYALAANCSLDQVNGNKVTLILSASHEPMINAKLEERMVEALTRYFKQPMQLEIKITTEEVATPIKQLAAEQKDQLKSATSQVMQDPKVQQLIDMYDATVEVALLS